MVDNTIWVLDCHVPDIAFKLREPFLYRGFQFTPRYNSQGEVKQFDSAIDNLILRYDLMRNQVSLRNSIHRKAHGTNADDFPLSHIIIAVEELSDLIGEDVSKAKIKKIETGLNIAITDVDNIVAQLDSLRDTPFQPMMHNGNSYGAIAYFSHYTAKAYNKTKEHKLHYDKDILQPTLRWEVAYKGMAPLHKRKVPIPIELVLDLYKLEKMQYLMDDLVNKYKLVRKKAAAIFSDLPLNQMTTVARMCHPHIRKMVKQKHRHTYRDDKRKYEALIKRATQANVEVEKKLVEKAKQLLHS